MNKYGTQRSSYKNGELGYDRGDDPEVIDQSYLPGTFNV